MHGVTHIVTLKKTNTTEKTLAFRNACDIVRDDNEQQLRSNGTSQRLGYLAHHVGGPRHLPCG